MAQLCSSVPSDLLQSGVVYLSIHPPNKRCNERLYMVPRGATSERAVSRRYATAESLHVDGANRGNLVPPVMGGSDTSQSSPLDDDLEKKLDELFSEVQSMIRTGNKDDALDLLEANHEAVKEQILAGVRTVEEAAILDVIALGYVAVGDFETVKSVLDMLNEVVHDLKDEEPLLDSILVHMGSMHSAVGRFKSSMLSYQRALGILERNHGSNNTSLVTPLMGMAKSLGSARKATKAIDTYRRAISILEANKGVESKELVVPLNALGNLLVDEGKAQDAEIPFTRIVNIYTKLYGEDDEKVGMAMCALAKAKCAKGDAEAAIGLYTNAIRVFERSNNVNSGDSLLEETRVDLAELLHLVGRDKEGRKLLEECLSVTEKYKGRKDPSFVTHLTNLATSYSRSKDFVTAERLLRTGLRTANENAGPDDPSVTFPMLQLAVTLYNLKRDEEAERLALEALRIREQAFGPASLPVGEALDCLICIKHRLGREDGEILEMLKRNLRIQEKAFGGESGEVIETLKKIVFYLDKIGIKDQKLPFQRRLSFLSNKFNHQIPY